MVHLSSPFISFWQKLNTLNTNMFLGGCITVSVWIYLYISVVMQKSCHEHNSCIYTTVKNCIEPSVTNALRTLHAHTQNFYSCNVVCSLYVGGGKHWKIIIVFVVMHTQFYDKTEMYMSKSVIVRGILDFLEFLFD